MTSHGTTDRYTGFVSGGFGRTLSRRLGLPQPVALRRYEPGQPLLDGPIAVWAVDEPLAAVAELVRAEGLEVHSDGETQLSAVVVDARGATVPASLDVFPTQVGPALKRLRRCGRVVVLGRPADAIADPAHAAAQRALEGIVRSVGKELRSGATANLVLVADGAVACVESTLRFLLSSRSAYVDGQVVHVGPASELPATDWRKPLQGKVAVVSGAARGIGAAIAEVLARDGATVVAVDVPAAGEALANVANQVAGTALQLDVTAPDAGRRIAEHAHARHGGLDVMVHNAGITRDRLLVNMDADRWDGVLAVNLESQLRIDDVLLGEGGLADGGRVVCLSSTSGVAGNRGQVNYAATKAGVIGMVRARAAQVAERGITYNAVAPGFIETALTARIPLATREVGRRINSLSQGGQPVDVAETVAWLAQPGTAGVNGQVLRVCGQSLLGA
ncbi:3-oxoacyl-ACP reductase [Angustibacter sp. McL0619]|uniref:3-oxoacyl-ACP reductase n=1 Tax=Angustibacter sp. McL0619 TaxID=3415676 RepID=UPI003CEA71FA